MHFDEKEKQKDDEEDILVNVLVINHGGAAAQVEELTNLKKIAEKQLEEALESLQAEREQRYHHHPLPHHHGGLHRHLLLHHGVLHYDHARFLAEEMKPMLLMDIIMLMMVTFMFICDVILRILTSAMIFIVWQVRFEEGAGQQEQLGVDVPAGQPRTLYPGQS